MPPPPYSTYSVRGQCALVSGASSGIGEACAWRLAEAGCRLVLLARRIGKLEQLKAEIEQTHNVPVHIVQLDVQNIDDVLNLPNTLPPEFAAVDILVNNAGLALGVDSCDELSIEDALTMINSNISAVVAMTRAFSPGMRQRNKGHIINMSSIAAHESYAGGSVYCATKHAVDAMTVAARHEFVDTNVRVTAISPGAVKTEFSVVRLGDMDKADAVYKGIVPLNAWDIADNVMYAVTRPAHVQIAEIVVLATYQCSAKGLARILAE